MAANIGDSESATMGGTISGSLISSLLIKMAVTFGTSRPSRMATKMPFDPMYDVLMKLAMGISSNDCCGMNAKNTAPLTMPPV